MYKIYTRNLGMLSRHVRKILFIMRLTTVIIIAAMLQVSASTFAQKVTFRQKATTIKQLFKEITKQTGFNLVWNERKLNVDQIIEANFNNTPLKEVLDKTLSHLPLTYTIDNKMIVIMEKEQSLIDKVISHFKEVEIVGKVVDEDGNPLAGATVKLQGTKTTTRTNENGLFTIISKEEDGILAISYLGYLTEQVNFSSDSPGPFKVVLKQANSALQEVQINAGYYTVTDRERTGSISRITSKTIEQQPISNPLQALQNRIPGVEITQLTGIPGGGFKVQIRGQNSIASGNNPLYIIDGVNYPSIRTNTANSNAITRDSSPLNMINPNDIENIEVLKDADATAIYGSRGANGVILITTKKGTSGDTKINAAISQGFSRVGHRLDLMNTEQYLAMRIEAFKNDKLQPAATDYDVNGIWDRNKYTDWQDVLIGGTAHTTNASLNISGGNKNSNYLVSGNYYKEGTVFPGNFGFKRGVIHSSLNFGSEESRLNATFTASYSYTSSNLMSSDPTSSIAFTPNFPDPFDQFGKLTWNYNNAPMDANPMAVFFNTIDANTDDLIGNANLSYRIFKNLSLKTSIGYNQLKRNELAKRPNIARNPAFNPTPASRVSRFGNNYNTSWIAEPQINYNASLGIGKLSAIVGLSFQQNVSEYRNIQASNFSSDELMDNISSASVFKIDEMTYTNYKYSALFARFNYNLYDKYYLNITGRRDGSSKFGPSKQFANFGAVGAAWIFSEEKLIKDHLSFLSFGKIRGSYGITGNDQIPDYQYLQLYSSGPSYQGSPTLSTGRIANPYYAWETNNKAEIALQLGFLKDKINIQIAHFRNRSSNQLTLSALPPSVGSSFIYQNLPATVQNIGWELESTIILANHESWNWSTSFNLSIPKNKLIAYPGLASSSDAAVYIIGKPLSLNRYYNTSVDPTTGLYTFEDKDGNGAQSEADRYLNRFIGQTLYGGLSSSIRYKRFNFDFLISYNKQTAGSLLSTLSYMPGYFINGAPTNQPTAVLSRWQKPGDHVEIPKFSTTGDGYANFLIGTQVSGSQSITDRSFARLKNISFSYKIPEQLLSKIKVKSCELNLQGNNVFTLTKYAGLDPENGGGLPPLQVFTLGLKIIL